MDVVPNVEQLGNEISVFVTQLTAWAAVAIPSFIGAMVLLMIGAFRGQQTTAVVTGLAICLLIVVGVLELTLPAGKLTTLPAATLSPCRTR